MSVRLGENFLLVGEERVGADLPCGQATEQGAAEEFLSMM